MDHGVIAFTFTETMNASSIFFPGFILQNQFNYSDPGGELFMLTGGTVLSGNVPIISIQIAREDLNEIKRLGIARNPATSRFTLDPEAIADIEGNMLDPLENGVNSW